MSEMGDEVLSGGGPDLPRTHDGPEEWLGIPDPVQSFGNTVDQALQQLSLELAGIRAERDGLRLELEGIRTQLLVAQQQLGDRERFATNVRELGSIVQRLQVPMYPGMAPAPPPPPPQATVWTPPQPQDVVWAPPPPAPPTPAPIPQAVMTPPVEPPQPVAPPEPVATVPTPPPVAQVTAPPPPIEPAYTPPAAAEPPHVAPEPPADAAAYRPSARRDSVALEASAESFFAQPGVWLGEPPRNKDRFSGLRRWGRRLGTALAVLLGVVVMTMSIGPRFLPYQTLFVRSGSMVPVFRTGDMILLTKVDASDIHQGDIITFDRPDRPGTLVTHRVVAIETTEAGRQFQTKGDANSVPDAWRVPASGSGWKYHMKVSKLGYLFGYLGTPQARLGMLVIPAALLGLLSLIDIWKPNPTKGTRRR